MAAVLVSLVLLTACLVFLSDVLVVVAALILPLLAF